MVNKFPKEAVAQVGNKFLVENLSSRKNMENILLPDDVFSFQ